MKKKIIFFLIVTFIFASSPAFGLEGLKAEDINAEMGNILILNSREEGAPSPMLAFFKTGIDIRLSPNIYISPGLAFTGSAYQLSEEDGKTAIPTEIEYADSVWFLNIIFDFPLSVRYEIGKDLYAGLLFSPAFLFKVPVRTWGEGENQKNDMMDYFYGGRFIYAEGGGLVKWDFSEKVSLYGNLRAYFPVYHIWKGGKFSDAMMFSLSAGASFGLK